TAAVGDVEVVEVAAGRAHDQDPSRHARSFRRKDREDLMRGPGGAALQRGSLTRSHGARRATRWRTIGGYGVGAASRSAQGVHYMKRKSTSWTLSGPKVRSDHSPLSPLATMWEAIPQSGTCFELADTQHPVEVS